MTTFEQFKQEYIKLLAEFRATHSELAGINSSKTAEELVDMMLVAINRGTREDWLKYNPVMKAAAASVGIKKSPELREFVKANLKV